MLVFVFSETFWHFAVFEVFAAVAASMVSGTDVALLYDTMEVLDEKKSKDFSLLGKRLFFMQLGETIASLLTGLLVLYSLTLPAKINAVTAWIPFFAALTLVEPPRKRLSTVTHFGNFRYIWKKLFLDSRELRLILFNLIWYGLATLLAVWTFQDYWKTLEIPLYWFGYLWAGYNLFVALTGRFAHRIEKKLGARVTLLLIGLLPVFGYLGMAFFMSWLGVIVGLFFQIGRGLTQVVIKDALNTRISADIRATVNSISSLGVRLAFAFLGPLLGFLIDHEGHRVAFSSFSFVFLIVLLLWNLPLIFYLSNALKFTKK